MLLMAELGEERKHVGEVEEAWGGDMELVAAFTRLV